MNGPAACSTPVTFRVKKADHCSYKVDDLRMVNAQHLYEVRTARVRLYGRWNCKVADQGDSLDLDRLAQVFLVDNCDRKLD